MFITVTGNIVYKNENANLKTCVFNVNYMKFITSERAMSSYRTILEVH